MNPAEHAHSAVLAGAGRAVLADAGRAGPAGTGRAMSFGAIAGEYDRLRSGPPDEAVGWLVPPRCGLAVDLAAGTGLLARALAARAGEVLAVEPDARMGSVLRATSGPVRLVAGRGEALPLRDAVADGVFISSAWHWMDPERAAPEIARVLRDGGRFGLIWTSRDREVAWVREVDGLRQPAPAAGTAPPAGRRHRVISLPDGIPFGAGQTASFTFTRAMSTEDFVGMIGTYSRVITAPEPDRAATLDRVRAALADRFPGAAELEVPMRSVCWRADRLAR